jgi:hypothetical protein
MNGIRLGLVAFAALALSACGPAGEDDDPVVVIVTDDAGMSEDGGISSNNNGGDDAGNGNTNGQPNNATTNNADPDMGMGPDMKMTSTAEEVDPNCVDGMYAEVLPDPNVDISSEMANYSSDDLEGFYDAVLQKRYPVGAWLVDGGLSNPQFNCVEQFSNNTSTPEGALGDLSTVVHECGHIFDFTLGNGGSGYGVTPTLTLSCSGGDTTDRGGQTFARSRIRDDEYQSLKPDDSYRDVYLDGDPDNGDFEGGDQGFNSVLEETLQYVNSLATSYAYQESVGGSVSAMDGILTFLWYVERYLRMARLEYPSAYTKLSEDPCWRNAILTVWGRAWLMLETTEEIDKLGIDEQELFDLVRDPDLLGEIQRLRDLEGC